MPIYEYTCVACGRRASLFFRSLAVVEASPSCPRCGERQLERRMSRVWSLRSAANASAAGEFAAPDFEHDGVPFYGGDPSMLGGFGDEGYSEMDGGDDGDEDVAAFAREARTMSQMMGEPLDAEFDSALRHIEQGADPDDVFGEMDARAVPAAVPEDVT